MTLSVLKLQEEICNRHGVQLFPTPEDSKIGIAENVRSGVMPINGLRHPPEGDTSGWYVWGGENLSEDDDYFFPLHVAHLDEWCPAIKKYLGLPPGWRFLIDGDYEDVWFDKSILST